MAKRKNLEKPALARLYFIDKEIAANNYPNVRTLAASWEVGTATICRDIEYMRDMLNAPIVYNSARRGYYYSEKTFRLPGYFAGADDMLALAMAKNLLAVFQNTPLYESARKLIEEITVPIQNEHKSIQGAKVWYDDRIVVPPPASYKVDKELWDIIYRALRENIVITFDYQSVWDKPFSPRRVHPYQLLFDNGVWYLYGYSESAPQNDPAKGMRMYSLSRIKNAKPAISHFTLPKDFDFREKNDGSWFGVYSGEKRFHFRVAFYGDFVLWAKERVWAADQKNIDTKDGVIIDFTSTQYGKVLEWVLSKGANAEPLEPAELVNDWREHAKKMAGKIR